MNLDSAKRLLCAVVLLAPSGLALSQAPTVREVMEAIVAPATDVLWAAEEPMSDTDWQAVDAAMIAVMSVGLLIKSGDAIAEMDVAWASAAKWQAYNGEMIDAAAAARRAVVGKDFQALVKAQEAIYPPCEKCHLTYHPELQ